MLVVVVGLIGGSIHVLPPQHISLSPPPLCSTSSPAIICLYLSNVMFYTAGAAANRIQHVTGSPAVRPVATHSQGVHVEVENDEFYGRLSMSRCSS